MKVTVFVLSLVLFMSALAARKKNEGMETIGAGSKLKFMRDINVEREQDALTFSGTGVYDDVSCEITVVPATYDRVIPKGQELTIQSASFEWNLAVKLELSGSTSIKNMICRKDRPVVPPNLDLFAQVFQSLFVIELAKPVAMTFDTKSNFGTNRRIIFHKEINVLANSYETYLNLSKKLSDVECRLQFKAQIYDRIIAKRTEIAIKDPVVTKHALIFGVYGSSQVEEIECYKLVDPPNGQIIKDKVAPSVLEVQRAFYAAEVAQFVLTKNPILMD